MLSVVRLAGGGQMLGAEPQPERMSEQLQLLLSVGQVSTADGGFGDQDGVVRSGQVVLRMSSHSCDSPPLRVMRRETRLAAAALSRTGAMQLQPRRPLLLPPAELCSAARAALVAWTTVES